jgi:hypothetical protein
MYFHRPADTPFNEKHIGGFCVQIGAGYSGIFQQAGRGGTGGVAGKVQTEKRFIARKRFQGCGADAVLHTGEQPGHPFPIRFVYMQGGPPAAFHNGEGPPVFQPAQKEKPVPPVIKRGTAHR